MNLGQEIGEATINLEKGLTDYREMLEATKMTLLTSDCTAEEFRRDMKILTELISMVDDYLIAGDIFQGRLTRFVEDVRTLIEA